MRWKRVKNLRVLLQNRKSALTSVAGDSIQFIKTKEYLNKMGITAEVSYGNDGDLSFYDIIHLFNLIPIEDTHGQFLQARAAAKKIVLSTVFWDPLEYLQNCDEHHFKNWWFETMPLRNTVLAGVDLILPNSRMELEMLDRTFSKLPPAVIVPNATDTLFATASPERFIHRYQIKDFILSVGRISPRKNQLSLIRATKQLKLPLVLIGPINDGLYYQACRKEAVGAKVIFMDTFSQTELASAYAAAKIHALVSWYDTPGLVSLEAALAGCKIVTTDRGTAREYFGDLATYCDPGNLPSIVKAIEKSWQTPNLPDLKEKVLLNYTWEKAAQKTLEAYRMVV